MTLIKPEPPPELSSAAALAFLALTASVEPERDLVRRSVALLSAFAFRRTPLPFTSVVLDSSMGSGDEACFAVRLVAARSAAVSGFSFLTEVYLFMLFCVYFLFEEVFSLRLEYKVLGCQKLDYG